MAARSALTLALDYPFVSGMFIYGWTRGDSTHVWACHGSLIARGRSTLLAPAGTSCWGHLLGAPEFFWRRLGWESIFDIKPLRSLPIRFPLRVTLSIQFSTSCDHGRRLPYLHLPRSHWLTPYYSSLPFQLAAVSLVVAYNLSHDHTV